MIAQVTKTIHVLFGLSWFLHSSSTESESLRTVSTPQTKTDDKPVWDENGYVFYCPCHGRFGNQADQFLGSLSFAKQLNRTLILPPWRTYSGSQQMMPFDRLFQVDPLRQFHRVILASDFMEQFAGTRWPHEKRIAFCHFLNVSDKDKPCTVDGEFFAEFWRYVGVPAFSASENIRGISFDDTALGEWTKRFPAVDYPVIALRGPPAPFPVPLRLWPVQKYLTWSKTVQQQGDEFISEQFKGEGFVGIHLRNGIDWVRACDLLNEERHGLKNLMASTQCLGEHPQEAVTREMCLPTEEEVVFRVSAELDIIGFRNLFIATDHDPYVKQFQEALKDVNIVQSRFDLPQIDLYILSRGTIFIGNCVSSFSSFVRRERESLGRYTFYFGVSRNDNVDFAHEEL